MAIWARFKSWLRRKVHDLVWVAARSRIYRKLRSIISASLVPLTICGLGAAVGAGVAAAVAFPVGYGALIGLGITAVALVVVKACMKIYQSNRTPNSAWSRLTWSKKKKATVSAQSSSSRRSAR